MMRTYILKTIRRMASTMSKITVQPATNDPDKAWQLVKDSITKIPVQPLDLSTPIYPNKIRFVCISDTHSRIDQMTHDIPAGDVLVHAGDFSTYGRLEECFNFFDYLGTLDDKFTHKVVIVGNHELTFEPDIHRLNSNFFLRGILDRDEMKTKNPRGLIKNCIYLEEKSVKLFGINIFGSPWTPRFGDWAFNASRGQEILDHWDLIPDNTDVLITHGPPLGFGDLVHRGVHQGCAELLATVRHRVKPKFHIFGHIHEEHGQWTDGVTNYINASTCTLKRAAENPPIIFDIDLPDGVSKEDAKTKPIELK